jgi:arginyl-tRNA synthetase
MKEHLINLVQTALKKLNIDFDNVIVDKTKNKTNGDYSTNVAMQLAKNLRTNPVEIAEEIKKNIDLDKIEKIEVVKPGFINFFVNEEYLIDNLYDVLKEKDNYGKNNVGTGKRINIEFVSANPTGILHMGNARGGAYGDALARILTFSGYDVTKEYYINDAGNQIDNLALSIKARYGELYGEGTKVPEGGYHGQEIIEIAKKIKDEHPKYVEDIELFKKAGIEYLLSQIKDDLHKYRIDYDVFTSEKDIRKKYDLEDILKELESKGYIYEQDGAKWFKCSEIFDDKDHVLKKEDGTYTYLMPDIAYHLDKYKRGFDKMIDVLGTDHHGYVNRLKSSVKAMGSDPDKLEVKLLQLVRLVENNEIVKMSKRSGKSVTLRDLMDEIGVNAARYFFSKYSLDTQMDFDLNLAKEKSNENPVYYVSYAYARICSILNSYGSVDDSFDTKYLNGEDTLKLLEKLYEFKEVVINAANKELPHLVTNYVYELATVFHSFYDKVRVITEDEECTKANIKLLEATKTVLYNALNLIGVIPPEKM